MHSAGYVAAGASASQRQAEQCTTRGSLWRAGQGITTQGPSPVHGSSLRAMTGKGREFCLVNGELVLVAQAHRPALDLVLMKEVRPHLRTDNARAVAHTAASTRAPGPGGCRAAAQR